MLAIGGGGGGGGGGKNLIFFSRVWGKIGFGFFLGFWGEKKTPFFC